jgi:hypothetical protein
MLKSPETKHLKLKCGILLSMFAFKIYLRRYTMAAGNSQYLLQGSGGDEPNSPLGHGVVGRCRLTISNPR